MKRMIFAALCISLSLQSACILSSMWKNRNRDVEELSAANYEATATSSRQRSTSRGDAHVIRLHVMVDEAYRREHLRWQDRIEEQVAASSKELRAQFNVELEIVAIQEWTHDGSTQQLSEVLAALRAERPVGDSEDRVLAFTSSLPSPSSQQHQLGIAYELGEHMVLRGMQDHAEREFIEETLSLRKKHLSDAIYRQRLEHKRTTVLIHELGHSFGALHVKSPGQIMSPAYDHKTQRFSLINAELLETAFALDRTHRDRPHAAWQRAFLDALRTRREQNDPLLSEIPGSDLDHLLAVSSREASPEIITLDQVRAAIDREDYAQAWDMLKGQLDDATRGEAITLACVIHANLDEDLTALETWCARTLDEGGEPSLFASLMLANKLLDTKPLLAFEYARIYEEALKASGEADAKRWLYLAAVYMGSGGLSHAERVTALAGMTREASTLRDEIIVKRHHLSLFDVEADDEPVIYQALMVLESTLQSETSSDHAKPLSMLEALSPEGAPTIVARCRVAIARRDSPEVKKLCTRAAEQVPQSAMALWGLGIAQLVSRKDGKAVNTLEKAIALEPSLLAPWNALAHHYATKKKSGELDALRTRFEAHFDKKPSW